MRVPSPRIFYAAVTTWISDRCRRDADDGVCEGRARSFIHRNSQPLLTSPPQVVETMYWCEIPDEGYQLSLGLWRIAPPPPTWRKFFISEGIPHRTESEIERICSSHLIEPGGWRTDTQNALVKQPHRSQAHWTRHLGGKQLRPGSIVIALSGPGWQAGCLFGRRERASLKSISPGSQGKDISCFRLAQSFDALRVQGVSL
jgi:hypothetical protein